MNLCTPVVAAAIACAVTTAAAGQQYPLDSLLREHRHDISLDGERLVESPGMRLLVDGAARAQFVLLSEEHNLRELNLLATALFRTLRDTHDFRYVALEQGSVIASWLGAAGRRGGLPAMQEIVSRYPHAPTWATDEELAFLASVVERSTAPVNPVWGVDQELGALHLLERLAELAPTPEARTLTLDLARAARPHESDRFGDIHYLAQVATPDDFAPLPGMFRPTAASEADTLIRALQRTARIYHYGARAQQGEPTWYLNSVEREQSMKERFLERYRSAQAGGDSLPRVLAKLGHWHLYRGIYRGNVPTFGNFLSEFATANGMESLAVATFAVESPETWRNTTGPLAAAAGPGTFTLIDLRPLRPLAHQNRIADLSDNTKRLVFQTDLVLLVRGGASGNWDAARGGTTR